MALHHYEFVNLVSSFLQFKHSNFYPMGKKMKTKNILLNHNYRINEVNEVNELELIFTKSNAISPCKMHDEIQSVRYVI